MYVTWFKDLNKDSLPVAGGKGTNLGIMFNLGLPVPPGFAVTAQTYKEYTERTKITDKIQESLKGLDIEDTKKLQKVARQIQELIISTPIPDDIAEEIMDNYELLGGGDGAHDLVDGQEVFVAVRSSATAEDLPSASFAGQQATYLNIKGKNTSERPYRVCTLDNDCVRQVDKKLWGQIEQIGDIEKKEEKIEIGHITEIKNEFLPEPMKYLLNDYQHKTSENWMRIIETLSTFLRGIGLSKDKVIAKIIEWCRKQPHRENGEELEAQSIVERIFANEINCPNFDKLLKPRFGFLNL